MPSERGNVMEDAATRHLRGIYGLDPDAPHMALQFPRIPPGLPHPMFRVYDDSAREQFGRQADSASQRLQGFKQAYRQHAAGLLAMGSAVVPPGHPLYGRGGSVAALYSERDRLQRENAELRKKLEKKTEDRSPPNKNPY